MSARETSYELVRSTLTVAQETFAMLATEAAETIAEALLTDGTVPDELIHRYRILTHQRTHCDAALTALLIFRSDQ